MDYRHLGNSGLEVSTLGLGCNNLGGRIDRKGSVEVIRKALDLGVTLFDTADVYPMGKAGLSEEYLGEALGKDRSRAVIATKFGHSMEIEGPRPGGSRRYVMAAAERSLARLGTDWIDLYLVHMPDPNTPIEETVRALDDLVRAGKVRYVGFSNFAAWQAVEAQWVARELGANAFVCAQEQYSLLARGIECEVIPALERYGLGLLPFFPLASGLLTGKYRAGQKPPDDARLAYTKPLADMFLTERNLALAERYHAFAEGRGMTLAELAFAWLLARRPVASVIAGASNAEQLEANAVAVAKTLSSDDLAEIDRLAEQG